jgi:formylglycine-generating enzyme required for sulfatase activity
VGDTECHDDEKPAHEVTITKGFWLGQTPVTETAYQRVIGSSPNQGNGGDLPAGNITWDQGQSYCQAISGRLPTEAEWEYAARAGTTEVRYGNLDDIAWYLSNSRFRTHGVGQKQPNAFGLYDMLGNVWQWTADWYGETYYQASERQDPAGPPDGSIRILRGGSYFVDPTLVRASFRLKVVPGDRVSAIGLRCVEK